MKAAIKTFDSNRDSNAGGLWRTSTNHGELLAPAVNFKMNSGGPRRSLADDAPANFKTGARHPWRCRGTDRSRRAPANSLDRTGLAGRRLNLRVVHSFGSLIRTNRRFDLVMVGNEVAFDQVSIVIRVEQRSLIVLAGEAFDAVK